MWPSTARLLRYARALHRLPGKIPGSIYLDAAQSGAIVGEALAEFQRTTGVLGQRGSFGGGVWLPDSVDREYEFIRGSKLF